MKRIDVDTDLIRRLAELLEETGLSEIELGDGERRVRVARGATAVSVREARPASPTGAEHAAPSPGPAGPPVVDSSHPGAVVSPMVGTVYVAPEPGAAPFVTVGDEVSEGQTLLIVEAMKVMNPIRAPRAGKVSHIAVHDGRPVEYGDLLVILD